jgi:hypothetical protein
VVEVSELWPLDSDRDHGKIQLCVGNKKISDGGGRSQGRTRLWPVTGAFSGNFTWHGSQMCLQVTCFGAITSIARSAGRVGSGN